MLFRSPNKTLTSFDHVIVCIPPGTLLNGRKWAAYVRPKPYMYQSISLYNDKKCSSVSMGIHEIGHSLGLNHAEQMSTEHFSWYNYSWSQDGTGQMGTARGAGKRRCFNAAKSWQLGWYSDQSKRINPFLDAPYSSIMTGIEAVAGDDAAVARSVAINDVYGSSANSIAVANSVAVEKNVLIQIPTATHNFYIAYNHREIGRAHV